MQHRRDADGLAHFAQAGAGLVQAASPSSIAVLGAGDCAAAGLHDQHVVLQQLVDDVDVRLVLRARGLLQPTTAATPRMRPDVMASFSGRKEPR